MCGVIGYVGAWGAGEREQAKRIAVQSKIRGLHAFGWAWLVEGQPTVVRVLTLSEFLDSLSAVPEGHVRLIGHCRYSTSGDWRVPGNNQPLLVSGVALAFNGVINMGTKAEMELLLGAPMETGNDGELVIRQLLANEDPAAYLHTVGGSFAGVWLRAGQFYAMRNERRPLWSAVGERGRWIVSTRDIGIRAGLDGLAELAPYTLYAEA